jgi:adenylate cyclase
VAILRRLAERLGVTGICVVIALAGAGLRLAAPRWLELLELKALDTRFILRGARVPDEAIVIVGIDERSLARYGRWPWPRNRLAELVDRLTAYDVRTIAFDAFFSEPDPTNDAAFAAAIKSSGRVVLGEAFDDLDTHTDTAPFFRELNVKDLTGHGLESLQEAGAFRGWIPSLESAAADTGHVNFLEDMDGGYRRVPLAMRMADSVAPALSVAALRHFLGKGGALLTLGGPGKTSLVVGGESLPIDDEGQLRVDFVGPPDAVPTVSALDVLERRAPGAALKGKLVLVAATAIGFDSRPTPFTGAAPGVTIHASVIDNLLRGRGLVRPTWFVPIEALVTFALGVATGLLVSWRALPGAAGALSLYAIYLAATQLAFAFQGIVASVVYPYGTVIVATLAGLFHQYFFEARARRARERQLSHYVGSEVAELLARAPERLALGGETREISILFSDIRGFSTITERLSAHDLAGLLTEHLGAQTDVVFRHKGFLDKYIGDAVMAFWNAPNDVTDHARCACLAALDIVAAMPALQNKWEARGWPHVDIGVGIDTGEAVVGNFGSSLSERFNYTAISDHVNTASRLEGLNKVYGSRILISEETRKQIGDEFVCRELDVVRVKGKTQPVLVYELLARRDMDGGGKWTHLAGAFTQAFMAYRRRRFGDAITALQAVRTMHPEDHAIDRFIERCRALMKDPPAPDWDGVYDALTK